jgi:hypothetical protein
MENLGGADFKLDRLPMRSQFSSVNDMLVNDFNKDGNLDLLVIGNLFVSEIETTRNDAGTGLLMYGDGKGEFHSVTLDESGFFSNRDAKKIRLIENAGRKLVLVANNDDKLQVFEWQ